MENENSNQLLKELLNALQCENIKLIKLLLKSGNIDFNDWIGNSGVTIVHLAAGHGTETFASTLIDEFIKHGADPNVPSLDQMTPVHVAAAWARVSVLQTLLINGGDPWLQDDEKRNAFNYAFEAKAWETVKMLHDFQFATKTPRRKAVLDSIKNDYNSSVTSQVEEELNETYCVEECSDSSDGNNSEEIFISSAEIFPYTVKEFFIEAQDEKILSKPIIDKIKENSSQCSEKEFKIQCRNKSSLSNNVEKTYIVEKCSEPSQNNMFIELLAAVKRRSERLANLGNEKEYKNVKIQPVNKIKFSGIKFSASVQTFDSIPEYNVKHERSMEPLKLEDISAKEPLKIRQADSTVDSKNIGDGVTVLILESDQEEIQVVDISDSCSSYLSLTDSDNSFQSCNGSPQNGFKRNDFDEGDRIRAQLQTFGVNAGPITHTTKDVYLRILRRLQQRGIMVNPPSILSPTTGILNSPPVSYLNSYCSELEEAIKSNNKFLEYASLEAEIRLDFDNTARTWRGGRAKTSFNYLLLDSRKTKDLPHRAANISNPIDVTREFLNAVFYIGKGQGNRPYAHLHGAFQSWQDGSQPKDPKEAVILDIWRAGAGVVCLQIFHNTIPAEAFTREAAMIDALGRQHVRNLRRGEYYGEAANWAPQYKRMLGAYLLLISKDILLRDGERILRPCDL